MSPLLSHALKDLSFKLVKVIAFTQAAGVQTLNLLLSKNIIFGKDLICLWLGDIIKQCRPKSNVRFIMFKVSCKEDVYVYEIKNIHR